MSSSYSRSQARSMQYFCWVEGLPERCTWQKLKDLVRKVDKHVHWTDVPLLPNGKARGSGSFRGNGEDAAWAVFGKFIPDMSWPLEELKAVYPEYLRSHRWEGKRLNIHLFDLIDQTGQAKLLACNCDPRQCAAVAPQMARAITASVMQSWTVAHPSTLYQPVLYSSTVTYIAAPVGPPGTINGGMPPAYICPSQSPQPLYITNGNGVPVNTSRGTVRTEYRGIIIKQLSRRATKSDVERLLRTVAPPLTCDLRLGSNGASKGWATATFATSYEVEAVIEALHGKSFLGRNITVQKDIDTTAVSGSPVVANGSGI